VSSARRVVLVSYHYYPSKRRAGFHFLADAYARLGWQVVFVTAPISWISRFGDDPRFEYPVRREAGRLVPVAPSINSFVHFTLFHPANLRNRALNALAGPLYEHGYSRLPLGPLRGEVRRADLIVFESTSALLLEPRFRELAPQARIVYRVSDHIGSLGLHPLVLRQEHPIASRCDLVSTPSEHLHRRFADLPQARLHGHALDKSAFDQPVPNPYSGGPNAVFLGFWPADVAFLRAAARARPDVTFHVVGQTADVPEPNIVSYGELPFRDTLPFVKHADVGLHTVVYRPGAEALTDSLKVIQFSYLGLPIVLPSFLESSRPNAVTYLPGDDADAGRAITAALELDVAPAIDVPGWDELAALLAGD
jgi:2-beta-glucuronyltransferase